METETLMLDNLVELKKEIEDLIQKLKEIPIVKSVKTKPTVKVSYYSQRSNKLDEETKSEYATLKEIAKQLEEELKDLVDKYNKLKKEASKEGKIEVADVKDIKAIEVDLSKAKEPQVKKDKTNKDQTEGILERSRKDIEIGFSKLSREARVNVRIFKDIKTPTQLMFETIAISSIFYVFYVYILPLLSNALVYIGSELLNVVLLIMPTLPPPLAQVFNTLFGLTIWLNEIVIITYFVVLYYRFQAIIKKEKVEILRKVKEEEIQL